MASLPRKIITMYLHIGVSMLIFCECLIASANAAAELNFGDGRRLVLNIDESKWMIEQQTGLPEAKFRLREALDSTSTPIVGGFALQAKPFSDELVARLRQEHIRYAASQGLVIAETDLRTLDVADGVGFCFSYAPVGERKIRPADFGVILLRSGFVLSYYAGANDPALDAFRELDAALRNAAVVGEIDAKLVATTSDGEIRVTIQFRIMPDYTAGQLSVVDSENPAFNDLAIAKLRGRKFTNLPVGRTAVQPVIIKLLETEVSKGRGGDDFILPLPVE